MSYAGLSNKGVYITRLVTSLVLFIGLLSGCAQEAALTSTSTPVLIPSDTLQPTNTVTQLPSDTPTPDPSDTPTPEPTDTPAPTSTHTPTVEPTVELGDEQVLPASGFSFRPPVNYDYAVQGVVVNMSNQAGSVIISLNGVSENEEQETVEELNTEYLRVLVDQGIGEFITGEMNRITVDGLEGTAFDISGRVMGDSIEGQTVVVMTPDDTHFFAISFGNTALDEDSWINDGSRAFSAILDSIRFLEGVETGGSACPVSTDDTYGYTEGNPIRVGGDWLEGPARERTYLDSLSGPNGEAVSYERTGSLPYGDTILDVYAVTYGGKTVTLYLDEYTYEPLLAPVGFTCGSPIPLSTP